MKCMGCNWKLVSLLKSDEKKKNKNKQNVDMQKLELSFFILNN